MVSKISSQFIILEQEAEVQQSRGVRCLLAVQVDTDKFAHRLAFVDRVPRLRQTGQNIARQNTCAACAPTLMADVQRLKPFDRIVSARRSGGNWGR